MLPSAPDNLGVWSRGGALPDAWVMAYVCRQCGFIEYYAEGSGWVPPSPCGAGQRFQRHVEASSFGTSAGYCATGTPAPSNARPFDSGVPLRACIIAPAYAT